MSDCIFCKIVKGEIPSKKHYEDEDFIVFEDISPKAPIHLLIIPKEHIESAYEVTDDLLMGKINNIAKKLFDESDIKGYRLLSNVGKEAGQVVFHLHVHFLGYK